MSDSRPRIAVTGFGAVSAMGGDAATLFTRLVRGDIALQPLQDRIHCCREVPIVGQVREADPSVDEGVDQRTSVSSRSLGLALRAAREAIRCAGPAALRFELVVGASTGATCEGVADCVATGEPSAIPLVRRLASEPIGAIGHQLANALDRIDSATVLCSACSSGALAIAVGAMRLEQGAELPQIVGGTDSLNLLTVSGFESLGAMSSEPCRPFDEDRQGLNLGEGAAFLLLETEDMVQRRGARVLAWLDGFAVGAEAHHLTHPDPDAVRASTLIREALCRARIDPASVGYVNAHGTATLANDAMECRALHLALGAAVDATPVSSSKGQIGHTLAAAGAIEAVVTTQALLEQMVPPTGGLSRPAQECRLTHVPNVGIPVDVGTALSTSFGFGGACSVLAFSRADRSRSAAAARTSIVDVNTCEDEVIWVSGLCTLGPTGIRRGKAVADWLTEAHGDSLSALPFEPLDLLVMERSRRFDRLTAMTTLGCEFGLEDAGLESSMRANANGQSGAEPVGLVLGNALGAVGRSAQFVERLLSRGAKGANPAEFPHLLPSSTSGNASIYASLRGPVFNVSDLGATAQAAMELGVTCLRARTASVMVVGTTECRDEWLLRAAAGGGELVARRADVNDGAAWIVIESRRHAVKRGAKGCTLTAHGWLAGPNVARYQLPRPRPDSVVLWAIDPSQHVEDHLKQHGWAAVSRQTCLARRYDGWSHPGFVLAAGAAMVTTGYCSSCLVVTDSSRGPHYALFGLGN